MNKTDLAQAEKTVPKDRKRLRACVQCKLVKTENQFKSEKACENKCWGSNGLDEWYDNTTTNFSGIISMMIPKKSWVAKWNEM